MNQITPAIKLHTTHQNNGTYLNSIVIEHQNNNYHLHGCTGTTIYIFQQSICLYVLSINETIGTIGLHAFMVPESDPINSLYFHNNKEIRETLGEKWESMKPLTIVTKLIDYLY